MDEEGLLPRDLKRGVLSEDGIYDALERNKELVETKMTKGEVGRTHDTRIFGE
ncbi:MAG: DUF4298 domain-containing protein [Butyrivibrio sp.]|nr:DUF4298 domain-containing protein [Butyrivibrio sp.]